jgi:hypothetical protein
MHFTLVAVLAKSEKKGLAAYKQMTPVLRHTKAQVVFKYDTLIANR